MAFSGFAHPLYYYYYYTDSGTKSIIGAKPMGFDRGGVWGMGYSRPMGFCMQIPAHRVGGPEKVWDARGYGLSEVCVMTGSTVLAIWAIWLFPSSWLSSHLAR